MHRTTHWHIYNYICTVTHTNSLFVVVILVINDLFGLALPVSFGVQLEEPCYCFVH